MHVALNWLYAVVVYFMPGFNIIFYCNKSLTAFYNLSMTVNKIHMVQYTP